MKSHGDGQIQSLHLRMSQVSVHIEHFKTFGVYITCTVTALHFKHATIGSYVTSEKCYAGQMIAEHATVAKGGTVKVPYSLTILIGFYTDEICGLNINVVQIVGNSKKARTGQLYGIPRVNKTVDILSQVWNICIILNLNTLEERIMVWNRLALPLNYM
ncbi:unnamed protein product [Mytilus coruscus]|uniref:Uncharacterized protein n=1 Tax=Mytilus coruscus TaxID=42192 RepID=A0A6J8ESR4_MYTCO|nr:unnamed protein product [Mytilus coruscus]